MSLDPGPHAVRRLFSELMDVADVRRFMAE